MSNSRFYKLFDRYLIPSARNFILFTLSPKLFEDKSNAKIYKLFGRCYKSSVNYGILSLFSHNFVLDRFKFKSCKWLGSYLIASFKCLIFSEL